jgi:quercetin dioxygenase-like cupin family protein
MRTTHVLAGGLAAALLVTVVLSDLARATPSSGSTSTVLGPPALFSPFKIKRKVPSEWGVEIEAKQGLEVVTQQIVFAVGGQSGWHSHPGPVFIAVKEGTMTFYEEDCSSKVLSAGEGFLDVGEHAHLARNESGTPATNIVTYFVPPNTPVTALRDSSAPQPLNCPL